MTRTLLDMGHWQAWLDDGCYSGGPTGASSGAVVPVQSTTHQGVSVAAPLINACPDGVGVAGNIPSPGPGPYGVPSPPQAF